MLNNEPSVDNERYESVIQCFQKELDSYPYTYTERYLKWVQFLNQNQQDQSYLTYLTKFLDFYPFNRKYWLQYISLVGPDGYLTCLLRNPKCFEVWENYLDYLQVKINSKDSSQNGSLAGNNALLKKQIQRAIMEIGADVNAGKLYKLYYPLLNQNVKYEFYKKIFGRCLVDLQDFYEMFQKWLQQFTVEQLKAILIKENKGKFMNTTEIDRQTAKNYLEQEIKKLYERTLQYRHQRLQAQRSIRWVYFQDKFTQNGLASPQELQQNYQKWKDLIQLERSLSISQNLSYSYERSIIAHPQMVQMWEQTFFYLQNESGKYPKVLSILRNNSIFFLTYPHKQLYFYWCDLEQRQNATKTRNMYVELERFHSQQNGYSGKTRQSELIQIYFRHIQFEIREKKWNEAKAIFDNMLAIYANNIDLLCYIVIEYVNFIIKYYKDYEYPKKLLKMYFDYLPYSHYLFINYLEFMKNYENKEGYYDELMVLIIGALTKAKKTLLDVQYGKVVKIVKYYLRTVLTSIYLIKISQRKVMEIQGKQ